MKSIKENKTLVVLTGPTAVGKTQTSLEIARILGADIISADARQFYKELKVGTASPSLLELSQAPHHFIGHLSIFDYYNASIFENQALNLLETLFKVKDHVLLTGGSGLYIDALCNGIDDMPDVDPKARQSVRDLFQREGLAGLRLQLKNIDPEYFEEVDPANPNRIMRGIEVYYSTGRKFSEFRINQHQPRNFRIKKIILNRPRNELFERINQRTRSMIREGMIEEALVYYKFRNLNALNTVGYKEIFNWLDNYWDLPTAIEKIATQTRRYAKRQITWFKRYHDAHWFAPSQIKEILDYISA